MALIHRSSRIYTRRNDHTRPALQTAWRTPDLRFFDRPTGVRAHDLPPRADDARR